MTNSCTISLEPNQEDKFGKFYTPLTTISLSCLNQKELIEKILYYARKGNPDAQYDAGILFLNGFCNMVLDRDQAIEWFRLAAAKGHINSMFNMAVMLRIDNKLEEAISLFEDIIQRGDTGGCTFNGEKWNVGDLDAKYQLAMCFEQYDQLNKAFELYIELDKKRNFSATYKLGYYWLNNKNYQEAALCFQKAGNWGHLNAQFELARMHYMGNHPQANQKIAILLWEGIAKKGHSKSLYKLEELGELNDIDIMFILACLHFESKHPQSDKKKAILLWKQAAEKGHFDSLNNFKFCEKNHKELF